MEGIHQTEAGKHVGRTSRRIRNKMWTIPLQTEINKIINNNKSSRFSGAVLTSPRLYNKIPGRPLCLCSPFSNRYILLRDRADPQFRFLNDFPNILHHTSTESNGVNKGVPSSKPERPLLYWPEIWHSRSNSSRKIHRSAELSHFPD